MNSGAINIEQISFAAEWISNLKNGIVPAQGTNIPPHDYLFSLENLDFFTTISNILEQILKSEISKFCLFNHSEFQILEAKNALQALINKKDPFTSHLIPDRSILYNKRIANCFDFIVAQIETILDQKSIFILKSGKSFEIPVIFFDLDAFQYSEHQISTYELCRRINTVLSARHFSLSPIHIASLLYDFRLFQAKFDAEESIVLSSTNKGRKRGFHIRVDRSQNKSIYYLSCDIHAQKFIISNISHIIAAENISLSDIEWTPDLDRKLIIYVREGLPIASIANKLQCNGSQVREQISLKKWTHKYINAVNQGHAKSACSNKASATSVSYSPHPYNFPLFDDHDYYNRANKGKHSVPLEETDESERIVQTEPSDKTTAVRLKLLQPDPDEFETSCVNCKFYRNGDCFGKKAICEDFHFVAQFSKEDRENWPENGSVSEIRQRWKRK